MQMGAERSYPLYLSAVMLLSPELNIGTLGGLLFSKNDLPWLKQKVVDIVDGQQRLITLAIILAILQHRLALKANGTGIDSKISKMAKSYADKIGKLLQPRNGQYIIQGKDPQALHPLDPRVFTFDPANNKEKLSHLLENDKRAVSSQERNACTISKWLGEQESLDKAGNFLLRFYDTLMNRVYWNGVLVADVGLALESFVGLNSQSSKKQLDDADIVKVILCTVSSDRNNQQSSTQVRNLEHWRDIEKYLAAIAHLQEEEKGFKPLVRDFCVRDPPASKPNAKKPRESADSAEVKRSLLDTFLYFAMAVVDAKESIPSLRFEGKLPLEEFFKRLRKKSNWDGAGYLEELKGYSQAFACLLKCEWQDGTSFEPDTTCLVRTLISLHSVQSQWRLVAVLAVNKLEKLLGKNEMLRRILQCLLTPVLVLASKTALIGKKGREAKRRRKNMESTAARIIGRMLNRIIAGNFEDDFSQFAVGKHPVDKVSNVDGQAMTCSQLILETIMTSKSWANTSKIIVQLVEKKTDLQYLLTSSRDKESFQLEHIMPQVPPEGRRDREDMHWWKRLVNRIPGEADPKTKLERFTDMHQHLVHQLGNLTIIK